MQYIAFDHTNGQWRVFETQEAAHAFERSLPPIPDEDEDEPDSPKE
jgi:hypothetical protein